MKKYEKADIQRAYICGKYAVRTVFWSGESDLSRVYGTDGGQQYVAGGGRIPDHGSRAAASWSGCPGDKPGGRAPGTEQQVGQKVRTVLYLHAVSDDRPLFRDPQMRYSLLYCGDRADPSGNGAERRARRVFFPVFCCSALLLPSPGGDPDLGGKSAQSPFPVFSGDTGREGPDLSHGRDRGGRSFRSLCGQRVFLQVFWKGTIQWMRWQDSPSGSSLWM